MVKILGTDQFVWDGDNIYITDPMYPNKQIRIGRYDGINYGIGFTQDDGATWIAAFGFDGINLNYATIPSSQVTGLSDTYLPRVDAANMYETIENVGALNAVVNDLNQDVRQNIQFTAGGIVIRQQGTISGFSSRFTSTALEFWEDNDRIAWFENRALNVDNIISNKRMSVGNLLFSVEADNSVAVKWYRG
jgi:hypothetical protein